jgi:hypothetical protein
VAETLDRPGIWNRAGLKGSICGMDIAEALSGLPAALDAEFAKRLLIAAERHYLVSYLQATDTENG